MPRGLAIVFAVASACACASGCSSDADGATNGAAAEALLGGASMRDTPWPSDVFLRDGRINVTDVAIEGGQPGPLGTLAASLSELDGAPTYTSAFFPVIGDLPDGAMAGAARWIDLDDARAPETTGMRCSKKAITSRASSRHRRSACRRRCVTRSKAEVPSQRCTRRSRRA
jgi:hypothetical protein